MMTKYYRWLLLLCFCLPYFSQAHTAFLKVDEAFRLSVHIEQLKASESTLVANFIIAPKYYLYRNRITISNDNDLAPINFPAPNKILHDGDKIYSAYAHEVTLYIPIKHTAKQPFSTTITYQGCAEAGLCYPPTKNNYTSTLINKKSLLAHLKWMTTCSDHSSKQQCCNYYTAKQYSILLLDSLFWFAALFYTLCTPHDPDHFQYYYQPSRKYNNR